MWTEAPRLEVAEGSRPSVRPRRRWPRVLSRLPFAVALALATVAGSAAEKPKAVTPDPAWTLDASEEEIEEFLTRAEVVEAREIGSGITRPLRLLLAHQGRTAYAAFKTVELFKPQPRRRRGYPTELEFTDDFRYERAAYLLDRELGLGMVPVVALRKWAGKWGAAILWVPDAIDEIERRARGLEPPEPLVLGRQRALMRVFDALILNTDRNLSNQLITLADWKLHLIDHSRSFRLGTRLPDLFEATPIKLSRALLERLQALELEPLRRLFGRSIEKRRVNALLARRDAIVAKVETDRRRFGDSYVFSLDPPEPAAAESGEERSPAGVPPPPSIGYPRSSGE